MDTCERCQELERRIKKLEQSNMQYMERLRVCSFALSAPYENFKPLKATLLCHYRDLDLPDKESE